MKIKKLLAVLLIAAIVFSTVCSAAASETSRDSGCTVSLGEGTVQPNGSIVIPLNIENVTQPIYALNIQIVYNHDVLQLENIAPRNGNEYSVLSDMLMDSGAVVTTDKQSGIIPAAFTNGCELTGTYWWLTFSAKEEPVNGAYDITLEGSWDNASDSQLDMVVTTGGTKLDYTLKPGTITVTGGVEPVATTVEVTAETDTVAVPTKAAVEEGNPTKVQMSAVVKNQIDATMSGQKVTWSVESNPAGVSVDETGLVTVDNTAAAGDVTVQASCNGKTDTATLTLTKDNLAATTLVADNKSISVPTLEKRTETVNLTATVYDQYGAPMNGQTVTWAIDGTAPTGVSLSGNTLSITNETQAGSVKVTATCGSLTDDATVTISKAPAVPTTVTIYKGEAEVTADSITIPQTGSTTVRYSAVVTDQYGATMENQTINWTLAPDDQGLSVNANGVVMAASTAIPDDYTLTATCGSASATVTITAAQIQFDVGEDAISVAEKPTYGATWGQIVSVENSKITAKVGEDTVNGTYSVKDADQCPDAGEQTYTIVFNGSGYTNVTVTTRTVDIAPKTVTVTGGITAADKEYDGNTSAILSGSAATFNGLLDGDELTVSAVTGAFQDKTVDENKTVNINKITLGGADAANYTLADNCNQSTTTATITAKRVTITGVDAQDKPYDGGTTATVTGTPSLNGLVLGDNVSITTGTAAFESKNVGTWDVTFSGYGIIGSDAGNYLLSAQPAAVQATISRRSVTITGTTASDKEYDGDTDTEVETLGTLNGVIGQDNVTIQAGTATFASADVGEDIIVHFSGFSLTGGDEGNYELSQQPDSTTANITKANYTGGSVSYNVNVLTKQENPARGTISVNAFFQNVPADATITNVEADSTGNDIMASVTAANGTITYESNTNLATAKKTDTYDVTISTRNYNNITATLTFTTVDKTPVIVSGVAVAGKTYDGKTVSYTGTPVAKKADGSAVTVTGFTYTWMKGSEVLAHAPKNAGDYKLRVAVAETDPAYTGYVDLSFTISKATITITAQNASVTVNSSMPKLSYQVSGLAAGEKLATEPTLTCNAKLNQIGSYPIVPSGAAVPNTTNYNAAIVYESGYLTVVSNEKPQVTVTGGAHGFATISDPDAKEGDVVAITVTCDPGYEVDEVTVTTLSGKPVRVVKTGGKHTFVMPAEKVKIQVTYQEIQEVAYTDVVVGSWYEEAVAYVSDNGIMNGVGGGKFAPNRAVTRAMVWTVLARMDGEDTASTSLWYAKAQQWAMETGVSDGTNPESAITREQLATMLYRYYGSPAVSGSLSGYVDSASVSDWAKDAMVWAVQEGLIQGTGANKLSPTADTTRAQLAQILMRLDLKF